MTTIKSKRPCDLCDVDGYGNHAPRCPVELERLLDRAERAIAILYVAGRREGWEPGPTADEAEQEAYDFIYDRHGHDCPEAASNRLQRIGTGKKKSKRPSA